MAYIGIVSATDSEQLSPNYIGFQPTTQHPQTAFVVDTFTANGVQTIFPLSNPKPITSRALLVSLNGELKVPVVDYNLDSTGNIDFTAAPPAGAYITVHHLIFPKNEATTSIRKLDDISGDFDGVTTRFTLTANGVTANILGQNVLIVSIDGVIQEPGVAYTMSGDDIIFSEAPNSVSSFYAVDVGTTGIGTPSDATVSPEKFLTDNNPSTGKVLAVNSSGGLTWAVVSGGVGATDLDGLADVSVSAPLAGQVLRYNGSTFVNTKLDYSDLNGPPNLATVATSGDYNDLTNTPSYPTDISGFTDTGNLLFNGDYGSLTNLPSIPDQITELSDTDIVTPTNGDVLVWNGLKWINDNLTLSDLGIADGTAGQVLTTDGAGGFTFTTVTGGSGSSFSGSYNDLTNKPTLFSGAYADLTGSPTLATVATSGSYNDLTNKPTIPTKVSELTNDSGFLSNLANITTTGNVTGSTLISTNANSAEGGEIQLAKAPDSTLSGANIIIDTYVDKVRFFESGGTSRGAYIDLTNAAAGANTLLNNRVSAANLALNTSLTFDNLAIQIRAQGSGVWIFAATVSGTATYQYSITYQLGAGINTNAQGTTGSISATTTPTTIGQSGWFFNTAATSTFAIITDTTNNKMYRVTWMTTAGSSPYGNFVSIERLV